MNTGAPVKPINKETVTHSFNGATHHVHLFDKLPLDAVVAHQAKIVGFLLKTGSTPSELELPQIPRGVRDILRS